MRVNMTEQKEWHVELLWIKEGTFKVGIGNEFRSTIITTENKKNFNEHTDMMELLR